MQLRLISVIRLVLEASHNKVMRVPRSITKIKFQSSRIMNILSLKTNVTTEKSIYIVIACIELIDKYSIKKVWEKRRYFRWNP